MRLCSEHMDQILGPELPGLSSVGDDLEGELASVCGSCSEVVGPAAPFDPLFVTTFRRGEERADYFAFLCRPCGDRLVAIWGLTT